MDEATKREIIKLRRQGNTYPQIANLVGYGLKSIQKVIGENAPELARINVPYISAEKRRAVARDYYANAMTIEEVHQKHGVGYVSIAKIAKEFREEYGGKKTRGYKADFTEEQIAEIRADYESGMTVRALYNKWCVTGEQLFLYGIIKELPKRAKLRQLKR